MKRLSTLLVLLLASSLLWAAGDRPLGRVIIPLCADYDLDPTSYIYVRTVGEAGRQLGNSITRPVKVKTTGSSASITASVASTSPFSLNTAPPTGGGGDILFFDLKGQPDATSPANIQ